MPEFNNTFISGSMNKDLDERLIPKNQYRDALNIDVNVSKGEDAGVAKNKMGNTRVVDMAAVSGREVFGPEDEELAKTIGAVEYEAYSKIYWFVACDTFDGIYEYDETTGVAVRVLQSNKATPTTPSKLNFRKEFPITGVNFIRGNDENNYLYWTDDYNPPRRVNITRVKSDETGNAGYAVDDPRIDKDINVILAPPLFAPSIYLYNDTTVNDANNLSEKFLYFSYRYKYVDDQYSSMSPFSAVSFMPKEYEYDYGVGNNKSMTNFYNSVKLTVETGDEFVKEIQVFVRDTRNINVGIIDSFSKEELDIADNSSYTITFNNNKVYAALPNDQVTRLYDNVPLLAKAQDVVGNRISYGNYVQFRDITDCNGNEIYIDYQLSLKTQPVSEAAPKPTWRSDRDYEVGLVYLDEFGRMTTVLSASQNNNGTIYVPPSNSSTANTITLTIKNSPPCWATHYRVYVKQSKKSYYNVFPILYYNDGLFRYYLINDSDLNKIKVGEYVIFKSTAAGATNSNKKYKILEIEQKSSNFLASGGSEIAGLYFKIKVDNPNELSVGSIFNYKSIGTGGTWVSSASDSKTSAKLVNIPTSQTLDFPITYVENPIFYGSGDNNGVFLPNSPGVQYARYYNSNYEDTRITIEIDSPTTYSIYKNSINIYTLSNNNVLISSGNQISQGVLTSIAYYFDVIFNQSAYNVGDRWVFNCRSGTTGGLAFGIDYFDKHSAAIVPGEGWAESVPEVDRKILTGAIIKIQVIRETYNDQENGWNDNQQDLLEFPPSPQDYDNIEEWWYESGARNLFMYTDTAGNQIKGSYVRFRRGKNWQLVDGYNSDFKTNTIEGDLYASSSTYPVRMIIFSSVPDNPDWSGAGSYAASLYNDGNALTLDNKQSKFDVSFEITQQENLNVCETVPVDNDADIYHELFHTYPIVDGNHKVLWAYDDYQAYYNGLTKLTQFDRDVPHYFNVGDTVEVVSSDDDYFPSGTYNITEIEDLYSVVVDLLFPGNGPVTPGTISLQGVQEQDQDGFTPAVIEINKPNSVNTDSNGWCWGNGLESERIYDDFNSTEKDLSIRVQAPIENYKQIRNEASICYSGVYQYNTSLNRLNEFNLSTSNFKYLDRDFGSIQKLYARDTDLLAFQENKVSVVLFGKNVMFDSVGGGQVVSVPEVLGTQIPINGEWGISKNPESFAKNANNIYFTDARRGVVLQMVNEQIFEISSYGMNDYFRDLMKDNPTTQKIGAYDPYDNVFVLSTNNQRVLPCVLTLSRDRFAVPKEGPVGYNLFTIITDLDWEITLEDIGYGTNWVNGYATSGSGSQQINATVNGNSGPNRSVKFIVTYCDGFTAEFILSQARGSKGRIAWYVFSNEKITG